MGNRLSNGHHARLSVFVMDNQDHVIIPPSDFTVIEYRIVVRTRHYDTKASQTHNLQCDRKTSELNEELSHLKEELTRTKATLEATERQISDVMVERSDKLKSIQDKDLQVRHLLFINEKVR